MHLLIVRGMLTTKTVFTNGCFDILHRGHVETLKYCKSLGYVVVGLNSDDSIKRLKGPTRPYFNQDDRRFMLESCKYVDKVVIFEDDTPYRLIKRLAPDIIVKGGDYEPANVVGRDLAEVRIFNYIPGYSTTSILEQAK
jgi:D-beta-D-heptose 7-phosphate kinase / D-beta-D-heptose 1-phosphate adenosyltransferase